MQGRDVLFSSENPNYRTPRQLFDALHVEFRFLADMAATIQNRLLDAYYGPDHEDAARRDALAIDWPRGPVFLNPPFSRRLRLPIEPWIHKVWDESQQGSEIVALLPARTDTRWWHACVLKAHEIRLIPHRVRFELSPEDEAAMVASRVAKGLSPSQAARVNNGAGFPSAVVWWRRNPGYVGAVVPRLVAWDYR